MRIQSTQMNFSCRQELGKKRTPTKQPTLLDNDGCVYFIFIEYHCMLRMFVRNRIRIELDSDRLRGSRLVFKNVLSERRLLYVKSFKYQECRQFGHLNSKKLLLFPSKMFSSACMYILFVPSHSNHFCFGCKNVFMSWNIFDFFGAARVCVCVLLGNLNEQIPRHTVGMECVKLKWMMSDVVCAHANADIHTCTRRLSYIYVHVLYDATNIHSLIHSFISKYTHFWNEFYKWQKKNMCQTINKLWLTACWFKNGVLN